MKTIGIIDYGMGNLQSVRNAFEAIGAEVILVKNAQELEKATHVVLPGVGSFAEGMRQLEKLGLAKEIKAIKGKKPFLGICLGMQLMASRGDEGGPTKGLDLLGGEVKRFDDTAGLRVPHIGWNDVSFKNPSQFFNKASEADYYFVHSYRFIVSHAENILATSRYGDDFAAIVGNDTEKIYGVQFHPEKSHGGGLSLLKRFTGLSC